MAIGFSKILEQERERMAAKAAAKLPTLGFAMEIPSSLALEQCSSELTAEWKAEVALKFCGKGAAAVADLTGGLGIDSMAFSKRFARVLYNDRNPALCEAAQRNFKAAGAENIRVCNFEIDADGNDWQEAVSDFAPDLLYLDPARRSSSGAKVFRLQDCSPDIAALLPALEKLCPRILLKLSPMADISALFKWAGGRAVELQVVEKDGECKELLLLLGSGYAGPVVRVVLPEKGSLLEFRPAEEREAEARYASVDFPFLFEPGAAFMKAGAFKLLCSRFPVSMLAPSVHLYAANAPIPELSPLGRWFSITDRLPFGKTGFKAAGVRYPRAEVSARGIPLRSEELRKRCGCIGGGKEHLFGVETAAGRQVLVCERIAI